MNMLDMHTREKVNKIHIAEMQRSARNCHLLRDLNSARIPVLSKGRIRLALIAMALVLLVGALLISKTLAF
jgi:hypothetical protein